MPDDAIADIPIYDVDVAKAIKDSIKANPNIVADVAINTKLSSISDNDMVMVTKKFNSPMLKIVAVDKIDPAFVMSHIKFR